MEAKKVRVDLLRSQYNGISLAVGVGGIRHGPDRGPWTIVNSWDLDDRVIADIMNKFGKPCCAKYVKRGQHNKTCALYDY